MYSSPIVTVFHSYRITLQVAATTPSVEEKMKQLQQMYEAEVEIYKKTIERMEKYPKIV